MFTLFCIRPKGFNVGNDVIFLGLQYFLQEAFGQVVNLVSLPATSRYESQVKAGLTSRTIHEINQYADGVIVGGGNLYENGELEICLDALDKLQVPLMLFSLSMGRIYDRQGELVYRTDSMPSRIAFGLNQKAKYSLARDNATANYLQRIGVEHVLVGGCPTIFLDRMIGRLPTLTEQDTETVLISIRNPHLMNIPLYKQSEVQSDILGIIEYLKNEGFKDIRLLCHDYRDIPFAASFRDIEYVYSGDMYIYLALLRSCALNISYRLHSFLPCLAFGTPSIKISYDERALNLVDTIGLGDWNINMVHSPNVVDEVKGKFNQIEKLHALREKSKSIWNQLYQTIFNTLKLFATDVTEYHNR